MKWLGLASALVLAATLVWAAIAKLRTPMSTEASFVDLRVPWPQFFTKAVPAAELAAAVLLVAMPQVGAIVALILMGLFSAFLATRLASGTTAGCACFGQASARPLSYREIGRNVVLAALAVLAFFSSV